MKYTLLFCVLNLLHFSLLGIDIHDLLFKAVKNGNIKEVEWYLNNHANVNASICNNKNPIKFDKQTSDKFVLVDAPCKYWTPLHIAVANGYIKVARLLLERKADVNAKSGSTKSHTPMEMAAIIGNFSMVKLLMEYKPEVKFGKLILLAAQHNHVILFKFFVDQQDDPFLQAKYLNRFLMYALKYGKTHMIKYLVEKKIDIGAARKDQFRKFCYRNDFLHMATLNNNLFLLEYFLKIGSAPDKFLLDQTALHVAAEYGRIDAAKILIAYGAHVNVGDYGTPLHEAVNHERIAMIKFLLQHGADVHARDGKNKTPVYYARNNPHALYWLLLYGATVDDELIKHAPITVSHNFNTPFDTTSFDMTRIFTSWRTNKKDFYSYGLFVAAHFNDYELLKQLFEHGADANSVNKQKDTPLIVALKNNNMACAYRLLIATTINKEQSKLPLNYAQTPLIKNMLIWHTADRDKFCHLGLLFAGKYSDGDLIKYCVGHGYIKNINKLEQINKTKKRKWIRDYGPSKRLKRV